MSRYVQFALPATTTCQPSASVDCSDPYSVVIHAILRLRNANGSTVEEILEVIPTICGDWTWVTVEYLQDIIDAALARGLLVLATSRTTYAVNSSMVRVNLQNRKYFCIQNMFRC